MVHEQIRDAGAARRANVLVVNDDGIAAAGLAKVVEALDRTGRLDVYVVAGAFYSPGYSNGSDWWTAISHHGDKGNYVQMSVDGARIDITAYSGDGAEVLDEITLQK